MVIKAVKADTAERVARKPTIPLAPLCASQKKRLRHKSLNKEIAAL